MSDLQVLWNYPYRRSADHLAQVKWERGYDWDNVLHTALGNLERLPILGHLVFIADAVAQKVFFWMMSQRSRDSGTHSVVRGQRPLPSPNPTHARTPSAAAVTAATVIPDPSLNSPPACRHMASQPNLTQQEVEHIEETLPALGYKQPWEHLNRWMTDADLELWGKAGLFENVEKMYFPHQTLLTGCGLQWLGPKSGCRTLTWLDLRSCNLKDEDLQLMAEAGCFDQLETLMLDQNPHITCKGLSYIARRGCNQLITLDVFSNKHLFAEGLDDLIAAKGFPKLQKLGLGSTDVTEIDLSALIDGCEWMRNISGLVLTMNPTLHQLPNSISRLSKLHAMSLAGSDRISVLNIGTLSLIARGVFKGRSLCSTLMRPLWDICQQHESEDDKMRAMCEAAGIPWQDEV